MAYAPEVENDQKKAEDGLDVDRTISNLDRTSTVDTDARDLQAAGYTQELQRTFSLPAMGCLCLCLMATWEALSTVISAALISGGAPCLFYN